MVTKDSVPSMQSRSTTTPTGEESVTPVSQPSSLGELTTSMVTETFHKTTAFAASVKGTPDPVPSELESILSDDNSHSEVELTWEEDEGLYIPSFLEEALGGNCNLQIKMACTMQGQEKRDRKCFICQSGDHLMKDHYKGKNGVGPLQPKGPPQNKSAHEMAKASLPGQATSQGAPPR